MIEKKKTLKLIKEKGPHIRKEREDWAPRGLNYED
jgi:hypothetical protein